jgi:NAD(P)-dependent dehydrogenase (short-subunit alcohol dehydrogenase family)
MKLARGCGLVAIVTGASSGIGRETARRLAAKGVHVVASARRGESLEALSSEIHSGGGGCTPVVADLSAREEVRSLIARTLAEHGKIDILVCNAGEYIRGRLQEVPLEAIERSMAVNFYGVVALITEALPQMLKRRSGHIVAVSSVDGKKGLRSDGPYVAAKSALTGYMDVLRQDLRGTGIGVSTLFPGRVDTPMIGHLAVPRVSAKISAARVARGVIRAIELNRAELTIPLVSSKAIIILSAISAPLGDLLIRIFRLEGEENSP